MKTLLNARFVLGCLVVLLTTSQRIWALEAGFVNGANFTHPLQLSLEEQNVTLGGLKAAGVKAIRIGFYATDLDAAGVAATIRFLRANGLDKLVDAYGVHSYSWADNPGDSVAGIHRLRRVQEQDLSECHRQSSTDGKPCWITEWGFMNNNMSCPSDENACSELIQEMLKYFRQLADQRTLVGLTYYTWTGDRAWDVYRCDGLTVSGRLALEPM